MPSPEPDLNLLINLSPNIFLETDIQGRVVYAGHSARVLFNRRGITGLNLNEIFDAATSSHLLRLIREVLENHSPRHSLLRYKNRFYNLYAASSVSRCVFCLEDITERKELAAILAKTKIRLEFAEKTAHIGYWEIDVFSKKIYWSAEMYRLFGFNPAQTTLRRNLIKEHIFPEDLPLYKEKLRELLRKKNPVEGLIRIRRPNKSVVHCLFKAGILTEEHQQKIAGTFQDLSQLVETQMALQKAKARAEQSDRAKSYFLAQASHDLRQPMQALKIFISGLREEGLNKRQLEILNKIESSADNLKTLLDNFLDLSKLEAGGTEVHPEKFNICTLINKLAAEFSVISAQHKINFRYVSCHYIVYTDPILVERILRNFLSNAFKFTRDKVLIGCKINKGKLKIMVLDNGIGIAPDEQKHIFEEFYQSPGIKNNRRLGTGLGLAIAGKIAALIGAGIEVKSVPGQGSCFSFSLPLIKKFRACS